MILVTGSTGFIGSWLCKEMARRKIPLRLLVRNKSAFTEIDPKNLIQVALGDITEPSTLGPVFDGVDTVFHLASIINASREEYDIYWKNNVLGTFNLLKESRKAGVKRFVYCSSVGVMGALKEIPANEETPCRPDNYYGQTKHEAESLVRLFGERYNIPTSIVRPSWVYGPGDRRTLKLFLHIKKKRFIVIGDGQTWVHPVHVSDVVQGLLRCAFNTQSSNQIYIIAGEESIPLRKLADHIAGCLNVRVPDFSVPILPVTVAVLVFEKLFKIFRKVPPISKRRLEFFIKDQSFDITKAKAQIGYRPEVSLSRGILETVQWYQKKGWI